MPLCRSTSGSAEPWRRGRARSGGLLGTLGIGLLALTCGGEGSAQAPLREMPARPPEAMRVRVIRSFAHDASAYTQGLLAHAGKLYESTGLVGRSSLRRLSLETGAVEATVALGPSVFGEGLALAAGQLFQLTWKDQRGFVWDLATFKKLREFKYDGEGWGLCFDGTQLVMSDGSDRLAKRDVKTFRKLAELQVKSGTRAVDQLNELECVGESVYANVYQTPYIARIDARTGAVTGWIDASGLLTPDEARAAEVLNGIAYLPETQSFILTGKLWPRAFEVHFERVR
jgi:glutamine cyclotransferase